MLIIATTDLDMSHPAGNPLTQWGSLRIRGQIRHHAADERETLA